MHSKEDEHTQFDLVGRAGDLKPENDEAQWEKVPPPSRFQAGYEEEGYVKGWAAAVQALRDLNLTDAAEKLVALNNGQLVPVAH